MDIFPLQIIIESVLQNSFCRLMLPSPGDEVYYDPVCHSLENLSQSSATSLIRLWYLWISDKVTTEWKNSSTFILWTMRCFSKGLGLCNYNITSDFVQWIDVAKPMIKPKRIYTFRTRFSRKICNPDGKNPRIYLDWTLIRQDMILAWFMCDRDTIKFLV